MLPSSRKGNHVLLSCFTLPARLQACDLPTWERLVAVAALEGAALAVVAYLQFAQAHLLMQLRYGDTVPCPPQLLQRSQATWQGIC